MCLSLEPFFAFWIAASRGEHSEVSDSATRLIRWVGLGITSCVYEESLLLLGPRRCPLLRCYLGPSTTETGH